MEGFPLRILKGRQTPLFSFIIYQYGSDAVKGNRVTAEQ
jgi:hypothetical protein